MSKAALLGLQGPPSLGLPGPDLHAQRPSRLFVHPHLHFNKNTVTLD